MGRTSTSWLSWALLSLLSGCAVAPVDRTVPLNHLPALAGDYFKLRSATTGTAYYIYIRYPEGYAKEPQRRFPTVYLLDGDSTFPMLAPEHLFIHYDDKLPDAIIVGIAYGSFDNPRHFDFSPASGQPNEGGAPAFAQFVKNQLIPAVEARTRSDPSRRILVGQSRGGGFVFYSAFTEPDLFWGRIASSPTLMPGREIYVGDPAPARRTDLRFVVADGTNDYPELRHDTLAWERAWANRSGPWRLKIITIEGGTHAANLPEVYRRRWIGYLTFPRPRSFYP